MKITKTQLKQIIKEELEEVWSRTAGPPETAVVPMGKAKTTRPPRQRPRPAKGSGLSPRAKELHAILKGEASLAARERRFADIKRQSDDPAIEELENYYTENPHEWEHGT